MSEKDYKRWQTSIKMNDFFELKNGKGCIVYSGDPHKIMDIQEVGRGNFTGRKFICGYGETHPIHGNCDCIAKYGIIDSVFRDKVFKMFGIRYPQGLTYEQRREFVLPLKTQET